MVQFRGCVEKIGTVARREGKCEFTRIGSQLCDTERTRMVG